MMKKAWIIILLLITITLLGGFLRFYKLTDNPPSLNGDEISFGYAAYSILKTGHDEHGKFMPLILESVGDYKNPVPAYMMVITIKLFGLTDFSVRLPNALIGTLTIPLFFLFLKDIVKNKTTSLLGALFLSTSSWHIFYSRFAYEYIPATAFILLGIWSFMKMWDGKRILAVISAFFFILTMYTAPAPRLFIVVFVLAVLAYKLPKLNKTMDKVMLFILTCLILALPLIYLSLYGNANARMGMVFIANDIEFQRYINLQGFQLVTDIPQLLFFWLKRYLSYLQPNFIFFNALNMTAPGTIGLGLLYLFELPWLILGVREFIKQKIPYKGIFAIWLLTGIIPDSITNNQQHSGRLLQIAPLVIMVTTLGAVQFFKSILSISKTYLKAAGLGIFAVCVVIVLIHAFLTFAVYFPRARGEYIDEGLREVVSYVLDHQNNYKEVIFDTRRGIEGPYIITNSYLYLLFYSKYDPYTYQTEPKIFGPDKNNPVYSFNKYSFKYIDWSKDAGKKETLFIGSPWSFPAEGLQEGELLKKIYMRNGYPAFYIVSPK